MLQMTAPQMTSMYGEPGFSCVCRKGNNNVMKIRAALLKLPPKAVADGESVCTMENCMMLYPNDSTPDKNRKPIVVPPQSAYLDSLAVALAVLANPSPLCDLSELDCCVLSGSGGPIQLGSAIAIQARCDLD